MLILDLSVWKNDATVNIRKTYEMYAGIAILILISLMERVCLEHLL